MVSIPWRLSNWSQKCWPLHNILVRPFRHSKPTDCFIYSIHFSGQPYGSLVDVINIVEDAFGGVLDNAQRAALARREFTEDCAHILRVGKKFPKADAKAFVKKLREFITTTARRRVSLSTGYFFDVRLGGTEHRARPADFYFALAGTQPGLYVAKVYGSDATAVASKEWQLSERLHGGGKLDFIVKYIDNIDAGSGRRALMMPFFARNLEQLLHREFHSLPTPEWLLQHVSTSVLRALVALHDLGIAHCDVKADNVMFTSESSPVLIDLGSATPFGEEIEEGVPMDVALGYDGPSAPIIDLHGLASTLWFAAHTHSSLPPSADALRSAADAEAAGSKAMRAISAILSSASAKDALEKCVEIWK